MKPVFLKDEEERYYFDRAVHGATKGEFQCATSFASEYGYEQGHSTQFFAHLNEDFSYKYKSLEQRYNPACEKPYLPVTF